MAQSYVSKSTVQSYEDFVTSSAPMDLLAEMAAQRALVVEFRQSLEQSGQEKTQEFLQDVGQDVGMLLRMVGLRNPDINQETLDTIEVSVMKGIQASFARVFPIQTRMTGKDAETMSKLLSSIVTSAEKYKKILQDTTIGLDDTDIMKDLESFVVYTVIPHITIRDRMAVSNACLEFFSKRNLVAALSAGQVVS